MDPIAGKQREAAVQSKAANEEESLAMFALVGWGCAAAAGFFVYEPHWAIPAIALVAGAGLSAAHPFACAHNRNEPRAPAVAKGMWTAVSLACAGAVCATVFRAELEKLGALRAIEYAAVGGTFFGTVIVMKLVGLAIQYPAVGVRAVGFVVGGVAFWWIAIRIFEAMTLKALLAVIVVLLILLLIRR